MLLHSFHDFFSLRASSKIDINIVVLNALTVEKLPGLATPRAS
jgi:hypothetical protein